MWTAFPNKRFMMLFVWFGSLAESKGATWISFDRELHSSGVTSEKSLAWADL